MRIGKIIGSVTLSRWHPSLQGGPLRVAIPLSLENLQDRAVPAAEELIVYDDLNAGDGSLIAISEGGEAAQPFRPQMKPIDAYNAAILDQLNIEVA